MDSFIKILKQTRRRTKEGEDVYFTHVSMIDPKGKYQLESEDLELFWGEYLSMRVAKHQLGMAEKPANYVPVLIDIDLSIQITAPGQSPVRLYSQEEAETCINKIQRFLSDNLELPGEKYLTAVLLEKSPYISGDKIKNGYHIHFPWIFVDKTWQKDVFLAQLSKEIVGLDSQSCSVPWLMYGSVKKSGQSPYLVSKIYNHKMEQINAEIFESYLLFNSYGQKIPIISRNIENYWPRILSINLMHRHFCTPKTFQKIIKKTSPVSYYEPNLKNLGDVNTLVEMLDCERAINRSSWIRVGWIIHGCSHGNEEGLEIWKRFSARAEDKYDEMGCEQEWNKMHSRGDLTIGSLHFWAKQDSPALYEEFKKTQRINIIGNYISGSHFDVANYLYHEYKDDYVCIDTKSNVWYQCIRGVWVKIGDPSSLRIILSTTLVKHFQEYQKKIIDEMNNTVDGIDNEKLINKQKNIARLLNNLRTNGFKRPVIEEAKDLFLKKGFEKKLDSNPMLVGFQNGAYDLISNTFRPITPDDMISKQLPIDYIEYNMTDPIVKRLEDFLSKIFPDNEVKTYFLNVYCNIFEGNNENKEIYFWTGHGNNGKSITQILMEKMLGNHAILLPTTLLSGKKSSSGAANPELARAGPPVRHATFQEPDSREVLEIGYMKSFSGGDSYWARDLYKSGEETVEITPFFKITWICNKLPRLRDADEATFLRIVVIVFEAVFESSEKCPKTLEEQIRRKIFPRDKNLVRELPRLAPVFAFYLLEWRKNKTSRERIIPKKIQAATTVYRERNDVFFQFINESLEKKGVQQPLEEIYQAFKIWFRSRRGNFASPPEFDDLERYFINTWGDRKENWPGYSVKIG